MCAKSKPNNRKLGLYTHYQFLLILGKLFPWTLLEDCLNLGKVMTIYMLLWIGSTKCVF